MEYNKDTDLIKEIKDGVKSVFTSDKYAHYLKKMASFYDYSFRNTMLIFLQNPKATAVAGYTTWQKLNRQVSKGEKAIKILAPVLLTTKKKEKELDEYGTEKIIESEKQLIKFKPVSVFDVSQTNGEPLINICEELQGDVKDYEMIFKAIENISSSTIAFEKIEGDVKGYFSPTKDKIALNIGMSDMQTIKTLIHEYAHEVLHKNGSVDRVLISSDRALAEIEAESVAFIVASFLNLDTSEYSFEYIASFASSMEESELETHLNDLQVRTKSIINDVIESFNSLKQEKNIIVEKVNEPKNLTEKLVRAKQKAQVQNEKKFIQTDEKAVTIQSEME